MRLRVLTRYTSASEKRDSIKGFTPVSSTTARVISISKKAVVQTGLIELDRQSDIAGNEKYYFDPENDGYMALGIVKLNNADIFGSNNGKYYNFGTTGIYDPDGTLIPDVLTTITDLPTVW